MKETYLQKALPQIPRLLSFLDRNPFSPTYGCFFREYWHEKIVDFPNGHFQCAVYSLALVYGHRLPGSIYYRNPKLKRWIVAALDYSLKIQHSDGSFDEFYPNERGRAVTGIMLHSFLGAFEILKEELTPEEYDRVGELCDCCAAYIRELPKQTEGLLANHYTMILCALITHHKQFDDPQSFVAFQRYLVEFLEMCDPEGWALEYDGVDPGYLTTTISFLAKTWLYYQNEDLRDFIERAIEFSAHFVFPDGSYGGSVGSRQTLHFYSHGYEYFGREFPMARACAQKMLESLAAGGLVPPEIQSDRYTYYRVEEFLLSYLDYCPRQGDEPSVPYERPDFVQYFPGAKVLTYKKGFSYSVLNLSRGGVLKVFSGDRLIYNDSGIHVQLADKKLVSSQWIDRDYAIRWDPKTGEACVEGALHQIPFQLFNPMSMSIFKLFMCYLANSTFMASKIKTKIRRVLVLSAGASGNDCRFSRAFLFAEDGVSVDSTVNLRGKVKVKAAVLGDELHLRYVPQSRYFQSSELGVEGYWLSADELTSLNAEKRWNHLIRVSFVGAHVRGSEEIR